jgi:hypothetical protein
LAPKQTSEVFCCYQLTVSFFVSAEPLTKAELLQSALPQGLKDLDLNAAQTPEEHSGIYYAQKARMIEEDFKLPKPSNSLAVMRKRSHQTRHRGWRFLDSRESAPAFGSGTSIDEDFGLTCASRQEYYAHLASFMLVGFFTRFQFA